MPEPNRTSSDKCAVTFEAASRLIAEAARSENSLAELLRNSRIEPLDQLNDQSRELLGKGFEEGHSPIIITDGSVRMNLSFEEYALAGSIYTSSDLVLQRIESKVGSHSNGTNICYIVRNPDEVCTIIFHCAPENGAGALDTIAIQGGLSMSPIISFNPVEYGEAVNPPPHRRVHRSLVRRIIAMEILSTVNGETRRVHVCPLAGDGSEYEINDPHI